MNSRDRMLEAAICAIEAHGEAGVRVDEISSAAEVAKPSLYHFFGSREGLIAAAQAERYRRSLNIGLEGVVEIAETCTSSEEFERLVRSWVESFASDAAGHRRAVRLSVLGSSVSRPDLQAEIVRTSEAASSQLRDLLTLAEARGWLRSNADLGAADLALWFQGLWNGRYLAELSGDRDRIEGWDRVTMSVVTSMLFGSN